jgi:hypothetical protein
MHTIDHSVAGGSLLSSSFFLKAFIAISSSARRISRFRLSMSDFWMGFRSFLGMIYEESSSISMASSLLSGRETSRRTAV